jgi:hypothetical protein
MAMATQVVVQGTVTADGTLHLTGPVGLPPGPVEVIVTAAKSTSGEDMMTLLTRIRAEQKARGHVPRTAEEIDEDIRQMRDEWDEQPPAAEQSEAELRRRNRTFHPEEPPK